MFAATSMPKRKSLKRVAKNRKIKQSKVCRDYDLKTKRKINSKRVRSVKTMTFCDLTDAEENELFKMGGVQSVSLDIESGRYIIRFYDDPQSKIQKRIESHADLGKHKFIFKNLLDDGVYSATKGTVGCFVKFDNSSPWYAATNKHVFSFGEEGTPAHSGSVQNNQLHLKEKGVIQGFIDACEVNTDDQDTLFTYDLALVQLHEELHPTVECQCKWPYFSNKEELVDQLSRIRNGDASVFKHGLTTGATEGNAPELVSHSIETFDVGGIEKQIDIFHSLKISSANAEEAFMKPGDSGALVYLKDNEQRGIIAMCYIYKDDGKSCLAFPFANALNALLNKYEQPTTDVKIHCGGKICGNNARPQRRNYGNVLHLPISIERKL
ncbi:unnamed protein product [Owenia fusiformis]|uniref:Uncharacterized protein n=1 Tax=Owenia fusiformis TaxID=6347 RepID=A0A8S4Q905_OWEFU|nr:unnamed protein product [Owenia fusiformis]